MPSQDSPASQSVKPTESSSDPSFGRVRFSVMKTVLIGLLLIASCYTLTNALTKDVVTTQFAAFDQIVETFYDESDFLEDNPDASEADYAELRNTLDWGFNGLINLSGRVAENYRDLIKPQGYTVIGGAQQLWRAGDILPALLIMAFSVLFPIIKTAMMLGVYGLQTRDHLRGTVGDRPRGARALSLLNATHKYTMLDVFVVAVMVFAFSDQKLVSVTPADAVYWYLAYMVVSYATLWGLEHGRALESNGGQSYGRTGSTA